MPRFSHQDGPKGWHGRGYLPHFDGGTVAQFVTFNLADSIPRHLISRWYSEVPRQKSEDEYLKLYRKVERCLDRGIGRCYLKEPRIEGLVEDALRFNHGKLYSLLHWVIMPNHVHILVVPKTTASLSKIIHSIKSYTAQEANGILGRNGRFWNEDYFDRYIRDEEHFLKVVRYIEMNPVNSRLCEAPEDWPYGSARFSK